MRRFKLNFSFWTIKVTFLLIVFVYDVQSQNKLNVANDLNLPNIYTTIQDAINAASSGDTIYVYPTFDNYGSATINKKVTIIGPGYSITSQNNSLGISTIQGSPTLTSVVFSPGSSGSSIVGCRVSTISVSGVVKNISITRNMITSWTVVVTEADSVLVHGNFFNSTSSSSNSQTLQFRSSSKGNRATNNIFAATTFAGAIFVEETSDALIQRNIILPAGTHSISNSVFVDNIVSGTLSISNSTVTNNIFTSNLSSFASNNIVGTTTSGIFVGYPTRGAYSFDDRFNLVEGSPAIGYAFDGGDCGAFGGNKPYRLSGIPPLPLIYDVSILSNTVYQNDSLRVNINIQSNN